MRFLIIQEASRHSENYQYREGLCLMRSLVKLGHEVRIWGPGYSSHQRKLNEYGAGCNVILFLENYDDVGWTPILGDCKVMKVFWSVDGHVAMDRHVKLCKQNKFDIILSACLQCVEPMKEHCQRSEWFPNCYPDDLFNDAHTSGFRDIDFGYIGSVGNDERRLYLSELTKDYGLQTFINHMGDAMVDALRRFKVSFNINVSHDINFRTFESMGAGAALITNETPGLTDLFTPGLHCLTYKSVSECGNKVKELLNDEDKLQSIAYAGQTHVREHHTYDVRARQLVKIIEEEA